MSKTTEKRIQELRKSHSKSGAVKDAKNKQNHY